MSDQDLSIFCPIFKQPCIKEKCVGYESHTKQRFKNTKTDKYIPIDQISFYKGATDDIKKSIERHITIVRECRKLGKIIEIKTEIDNLIPEL